jgi:hypothetical protein
MDNFDTSARYKQIGRLIYILSTTAGLIALVVVASVVVLSLIGHAIPPELANWGGIILGFYFGQFVTLLKDYMNLNTQNHSDTSERPTNQPVDQGQIQ